MRKYSVFASRVANRPFFGWVCQNDWVTPENWGPPFRFTGDPAETAGIPTEKGSFLYRKLASSLEVSYDCPWSSALKKRQEKPRRGRDCFPAEYTELLGKEVRNAPSSAGNSMTSSERPSPEPLLKKEAQPCWGKRILQMRWSRPGGTRWTTKPININTTFRDCPGNGWGSNLFMFYLCLGEKTEHINKISRHLRKCWDSPAIIPRQSRKQKSVSCLFFSGPKVWSRKSKVCILGAL